MTATVEKFPLPGPPGVSIPMDDDFVTACVADAKRKIYYAKMGGKFWTQDSRTEWIEFNETQLSRLLQLTGFDPKQDVTHAKSIVRELLRIQMEDNISYAGPVAGYMKGFYEVLGSRILVTTSPELLVPKKGDWSMFGKFFDNLFLESEDERALRERETGISAPALDQRAYVLGWLQVGLRALYANRRHPGQALVLAGDRDCGKTLFQSLLTVIFGGRAAKPYKAMTDSTNFNGDMIGAEHQIIGDEACRIDMKSRKAFATQIKGVVAEMVQRIEDKHKTAVSLMPFWRLSISLNMEPENIMVLPPVDEDIADKLILLKAYKRPMPWEVPGVKPRQEDRDANWARLVSELPAFVHYVLHEWEIPDALRSRRFGVTHYHHPEILGVIDALTGQERLLELIDMEIFAGSAALRSWHGTALELEKALTVKDSSVFAQAKELLSSANVCGSYLGKLAKKHPGRVKQKRTAKERAWVLYPVGWDHVRGCVPPADSGEAPPSAEGSRVVEVDPAEEEWARATGRVEPTEG